MGNYLDVTNGVSAIAETPKKPAYRKPESVKELERIADAYDRERYPNTPDHCRPKNHFRDDTANGLTRCIVAYIRYKGGQAERINTTGIPIDERRTVTDITGHTRTIGGIRWRRSGGTIGSADISATIGGRSVKIEVKIGRDRQSEAQRQYQADIEAAGGLYVVAKNFTEFKQWYDLTLWQHNEITKGNSPKVTQ